MKQQDVMALLSIIGALVLLVLLSLWGDKAFAAVYDPQQAKGFPPLRDADSIRAPLYSFYPDGSVAVDEVRLPKSEDGSIEALACVRLAPSRIAQCVVSMGALGVVFAIEVPLNLQEV